MRPCRQNQLARHALPKVCALAQYAGYAYVSKKNNAHVATL